MSTITVRKCCVPGCVESGNSHRTLHLFPNPTKYNKRFNGWVFSIKGDIIGLSNEEIYRLRRVCHAHFEEKFCCRYNRLSNIAVPTLNLPGPLALPKFSIVERLPLRRIRDAANPIPSTSASLAENDHSRKKLHEDHSYSKLSESASCTNNERLDKTYRRGDKTSLPNRFPKDDAYPEAQETAQVSEDDIMETIIDCEDNAEQDFMQYDRAEDEAVTAVKPDFGYFSWQNTDIVPVLADYDYTEAQETVQVSENVTIEMTIDDEDNAERKSKKYDCAKGFAKSDPQLHEGYDCNICNGKIVRFRYTCLQCEDFDLCAACEARAEHDHHYVLRVPGPRPHEETQELLSRIRGALRLAPVLFAQPDDVTVKSETEQCEVDPFSEEEWLLDQSSSKGEKQELSRIRDALQLEPVLSAPPDDVTVLSHTEQCEVDPFAEEEWLPDPPPPKETMGHVSEDSTLHEKRPQKAHKQISRRFQKKRRRIEPKPSSNCSDTSTDETDSDDALHIWHSSPNKLQYSQNNQTIVVRKNSKPMFSLNEHEEIHTQIVVQLPERTEPEEPEYISVYRKKDNVTEPKENEESDFSGDDEDYVPDASESASRLISVKSDGRLITMLPLKRKRDNVVTRARSSNVSMPQKAEQIDKSMVQEGPYIQLERIGTEELKTYTNR